MGGKCAVNLLPEIFHGDFISSAAASVLVEIFPVGISNWALFPYSLSLSTPTYSSCLSKIVRSIRRRSKWNISPEGKGSPLPLIPPFPSIPYGGLFFSLPSLSSNHLGHLSLQGKKRRGGRERRWTVKGGEKGKSVKRGQSLFP